MKIKVISDGATGADLAGLDAALAVGWIIGGWVPKGRHNERGRISEKYPLQETPSVGHSQRTRRNVMHSDGTLILVCQSLSGGSKQTRDIARQAGKPFLVINLNQQPNIQDVIEWVRQNKIGTLNVAGSRESKSPGIYKKARKFLIEIFTQLDNREATAQVPGR